MPESNHDGGEPSLVVLVPRRRTVAMLGACLAFVSIGLWVAGAFGRGPMLWRTPGTLGLIAGSICVVTFGVAALIIAPRLVRPALILDRAGFDDRASVVAVGRVHWSEVATAELVGHGDARTLTMTLRVPEPVLSRLRPSVRRRVEGQRRRTGGEINIPVADLDIEPEVLLARVRRHLGQS